AERGLMEWKKMKFMERRIGEDFDGLIISVTKFGFFVELTDLFVEGLVPLNTLADDRYTYHEDTRQIIGQRSRKTYSLGNRLRVLVDRIDPVEKKIQFAILEDQPDIWKVRLNTHKSISVRPRHPLFSRQYVTALLFVVLLLPLRFAWAGKSDLDKQLKSDYSGKTLTLRRFYSGEHLKFRSDGRLQGDARSVPGHWMG